MNLDPCRNDGKPWGDSDRQLLADLYADEPNATLARIFGRSERSIKNQARAQGLRKSAAYMATKPGCFEAGITPWNKGMKGLDTGGKHTRFKKGQRCHNWLPIGSERVSKDGYLQRKVSDTGYPPRDWVSVHVLVYCEHYGPVPPGHTVVFRDGNARNFDPTNLELVTRAELMRRNSYHTNLPPELAQIVQLRGVLTRKINRRSQSS